MPRPCSVCAHLKRAEVDVLLARQACNVVQLGRTYGLSRDALRAHRENHLPSFLPAFAAQADGLTMPTLTAEMQRLYLSALDNLARAEAGTLERVKLTDPETGEEYVEHRPKVSTTAVARAIREARAGLDGLVRLSGGGHEVANTSSERDEALGAAIRKQLEAVVARRSASALEEGQGEYVDAVVVEDEHEVPQRPSISAAAEGTQGPSTGKAGRHTPPPHSPESQPHQNEHPGLGNPLHLPEGTNDLSVDDDGEVVLSAEQVQAAARAAGITPASLMDFLRRKALPKIVHPEWSGNPAATKEERAAEGYADIVQADHRFDS